MPSAPRLCGDARAYDCRSPAISAEELSEQERLALFAGTSDGGSEAWSRALVESLSDLVAVVDEQATIRWIAPSVTRQLGYLPGEVLGRPCFDLVHPDDLELAAEEWLDAVAKGTEGNPTRYRVRHADGNYRVMNVTASPQFDHPSIQGMLLTASDVTEWAKAEELLAEQTGLLESIARGAPLQVTLQRIVQMIDHTLQNVCASISTMDPDGAMRVRSAPDVPRDIVTILDEMSPAAPAARLVRDAEESFVEYDLTSVRQVGRGPAAVFAEHGLLVCRAAPIRLPQSGELLGSLSIFHRDHAAPTPFETELMGRALDLAAIALERHRIETALAHQTSHDQLTGLPNRLMVLERIADSLNRSVRQGVGVAVLLIDLDRFKVVNESIGHAHGDELLRQVAQRLTDAMRPGDTLGRFGGDEFMVVCPRVRDVDVAGRIATRFLGALKEPVHLADAEVHVTASIGIAFDTSGGSTPESLVRHADVAMYRAKAQGRNQHVVFHEQVDIEAVERLALEQALRTAVDEGQFELHFQPVVRLQDGRMSHVEALVRWQRPGHGIVMPGSFIPLAEETGLIVPMGWWVLEEACRQAAAWPALPDGDEVEIAVNLSAHQLAAPDLLEVVGGALERSGLPPQRLCFEVTESALVHDVDMAKAALQALKTLGVRIAIDDFGTGYATLDYVRHFSMADYLKIDRSFVEGVERAGSEEAAIVSAAISLAKSLGFTAVAEGVETLFQMEALRALECDLAQGFLFSRPVPLDAAIELLSTQASTQA